MISLAAIVKPQAYRNGAKTDCIIIIANEAMTKTKIGVAQLT